MFTKENARELQLKGAAAKVHYRLARQAEHATTVKELVTALSPVKPEWKDNLSEEPLTFQARTLARVRIQIAAIQQKIDKQLAMPTTDSKIVKELMDAFSRLEIAEQKLSGRAAPGSLRPSTKGKRGKGEAFAAPESED